MNLSTIDLTSPFCLFADCRVEYNGRASSVLERGNYLLVHKADGSFLIHGATHCLPRNYQGAGSKLSAAGLSLICQNRKETIVVEVYSILNCCSLPEWSDSKIVITRTEKQLVDKIQANWNIYFPGEYLEVIREFKTDLGDIDLLGVASDYYTVLEAKRRKASIKDCTQLLRYIEFFKDSGTIEEVEGWLAAPDIGKKAMEYLAKHKLRWLRVDFD